MPHRKRIIQKKEGDEGRTRALIERWSGFAQEGFQHDFYSLLYDYARRHLAPRRLAQMRRRAGDPGASPRDYACGCRVAPDMTPYCRKPGTGCRFAARADPRDGTCDDYGHALGKAILRELIAEIDAMELSAVPEFQEKVFGWRDGRAHRRRIARQMQRQNEQAD